MANIEEASVAVTDFLTRMLHPKDLKIVRTTRLTEGWEAEAEVYEESSFIKALGLPTRVQDKNLYKVRLDTDLEVESYERRPGLETK
jgi:hypothetical protein